MGKGKGSAGEADNLYQRGKKNIWYCRFTVGGREYRESLRTDNREEAELRLARKLADLSPYHGTCAHTWEEAATLWWEARHRDWAENTTRANRASINVLTTQFEGKLWTEVNHKPEIMRFIGAQRKAGRKQSTINNHLSVLSRIADFTRDLADGWPDHNAVRDITPESKKARSFVYVRPPAEDIEHIFSHMAAGPLKDLCRFALLTGMRQMEIARLNRRRVFGNQIHLYGDQKARGRVSVITISDEARAIIERQPVHLKCPLVFATKGGTPYKALTEMWRLAVTRAQKSAHKSGTPFQRLRFHDLRHEYAIRFLENGGNIYVLQHHMRHSSIKITEDYLAYVTAEQAAVAKGASAQNTAHIETAPVAKMADYR